MDLSCLPPIVKPAVPILARSHLQFVGTYLQAPGLFNAQRCVSLLALSKLLAAQNRLKIRIEELEEPIQQVSDFSANDIDSVLFKLMT